MSDQEARRRIRSSLDESLLVEAAAGTGKTTELISRVVAVLEQGRAEVGGVVAVTFTRKAAGELKLRLRQQLDRSRTAARDPDVRARLEAAVARLEEARIGTIHSFCAELLRERPVEARVDPGFEEMADDEAPRLFARAFDRWIQRRLEDSPPGLKRALSRLALWSSFGDETALDRLRDAAWQLAEWRDFPTPWRRDPFPREAAVDALVSEVARVAELCIRGENPRDPLRQSLEPVLLLHTWIRRAEQAAPEALRDYDALEARLLNLLGDLNRQRRPRRGRGRYAEALPREEVIRAAEHLLGALAEFRDHADADLAVLVHAELSEVTRDYDELKERAGKLDFLDLLLRTRDLLCRQPEVRRHLQGRFSHIFVDEFQDTDPLQAEILLLLAGRDPGEDDWRQVEPVPGKLFLVGDPKQSIYRFRRADVLLYTEIKELLSRRGVGVVYLSQSFRAVAPIQRAINRAFSEVMQPDSESGQSEYLPLREARHAHPGQVGVVALPVPEPYGWNRVTKTKVEAGLPDTVAAFVAWLVHDSGWTVEDPAVPGQRTPIAPHHICILFRRFLSWGQDMTRGYTRSLESRGVAHLLVGARTFHQREEVETLRAALAAVEWPDDELAVFATLRGSLFAVGDDLLLRFRAEHGSLNPLRAKALGKAQVAAELRPIVDILACLRELHLRRNSRAMVETLQALLAFARAHAGFALRPAGHQVLGNVERVCDLARSYELAGGLSFRGFVERLNREAQRPGSQQAPVVEEGSEGVRIMTVHGAKGLEYPVVVLGDMTARLARTTPERTLDPERRLCAMRLLGCTPRELLEAEELERRRDEAEGVRIAYVAATRARDLLVVPAVGDGPMDGWIGPLNRAIYPPSEGWRRSSSPPGCPPFGDVSVLRRPVDFDGRPEGSVRPGLHAMGDDSYDVVWWDPAALELNVEANFGLDQEELLSEDEGGEVVGENRRRYEAWRDRRREISIIGTEADFEVLPVTELDQEPPGPRSKLSFLAHRSDAPRPGGRRFGTLVHTLLRDVDFDADREAIEEMARLQGRLLDAAEEEVSAAAQVTASALEHPLLERARAAGERGAPCLREAELLLPLDDRRLVEGVVDLAFQEDDGWVVVDFKTDADLEPRRVQYECQLAWYVYALEQLTSQPAQGYLLGL